MRLIIDSPRYPPYDYAAECAIIAEWITTAPDSLLKACARWTEKRELNAKKTQMRNLNSSNERTMSSVSFNTTNLSHLTELTPQISSSSCPSRRLDFRERRACFRSANLRDNFDKNRTNNQINIDPTTSRCCKRRVNVEYDVKCGENATKKGKMNENVTKMDKNATEIEKIDGKNAKIVSLYDWNVIVNRGKIFVEGFKVGDCEPKMWQTSRIQQRIKRDVVRSLSGTDYCLLGPLNYNKNREGIPKEMAKRFTKGFPVNWKKLLLETNTKKFEERDKEMNFRGDLTGTEKPFDINSLPRTRSGRIVIPRLAHWEQQYIKPQLDTSNDVAKQMKNPSRTRRLKHQKNAPETIDFRLPLTKEVANTTRSVPEPTPRSKTPRNASKTLRKENNGGWPQRTDDVSSGPASRTRSRTMYRDGATQTTPPAMVEVPQKSVEVDKSLNLFPKVVLTRCSVVKIPEKEANARRKGTRTRQRRPKSPPKATKVAKTSTKLTKTAKVPVTKRKASPKREKTPQQGPRNSRKLKETPEKRSRTPQKRTNSQKRTITSKKRTISPSKQTFIPLKRTETRQKRTETRQKRTESPQKRTETPLRRTETPLRRTETPLKRTETPLKRTETPLKRTETPLKRTETPQKPAVTTTPQKRPKNAPKSKQRGKRAESLRSSPKSVRKSTKTPEKRSRTELGSAKSSQKSKISVKQRKGETEGLEPLVTARPGTITHHRQLMDAIRHQNEHFEADFFSASNFDVRKLIKLPTRGSVTDLDNFSDSSSVVTPNARIPVPKPVSRHRTPEPEDKFCQPLPDELFRRKEAERYIHNHRKKGQMPRVQEKFRKSEGLAGKTRKSHELDLAQTVLQFDSSVDKDNFRDDDDDSDFYFED